MEHQPKNLKACVELAYRIEESKKLAKEFSGASSSKINAVKDKWGNKRDDKGRKGKKETTPQPKKAGRSCWYCGRGDHSFEKRQFCPAYNEVCGTCEMKGHIASCCAGLHKYWKAKEEERNKAEHNAGKKVKWATEKNKFVVNLSESSQSDDEGEELKVYRAQVSPWKFHCLKKASRKMKVPIKKYKILVAKMKTRKSWFEKITLEDNNIKAKAGFKVDTGAECSIMSLATLRSLSLSEKDLKPSRSYLEACFGETVPVLGIWETTAKVGICEAKIRIRIVDVNTETILGFPDIQRLQLIKIGKIRSCNVTYYNIPEAITSGLGK